MSFIRLLYKDLPVIYYNMDSKYEIVINNKRIYDYYKKNPSIQIETMNLILLDFMEQLSTDMTAVLQNTFQGQVMTEMKEMRQQLSSLQESLFTRIHKNNEDFIEKTKLVFSVSSHENKENLSQQLQKNTETFIDKLNLLIPKGNDEMNRKIQEQLSLVHQSLQVDLQRYLTKTDAPLNDFISVMDSKLASFQQPIFTLIHSNQEHMSSKLGNVKEDIAVSKNTTEKLYTEMSEYLNKYKISSQFKGACAEKNLEELLVNLFPEDEILNTTGESESGDFILKRNNENYIMFETKSYQSNVDTKEVEKYVKDTGLLKLHSIMMSQYTGIVGKKPYTIEINEHGNIMIYLHHVNFSQDKIKQAVQIIDSMAPRIKAITSEEDAHGISIDKEVLNRINNELIQFLERKDKVKELLKDQCKTSCLHVDALEMPDLSAFLQDKYPSKKMKMYCHCGYGCDNKKQLSNHQRTKHPKVETNLF